MPCALRRTGRLRPSMSTALTFPRQRLPPMRGTSAPSGRPWPGPANRTRWRSLRARATCNPARRRSPARPVAPAAARSPAGTGRAAGRSHTAGRAAYSTCTPAPRPGAAVRPAGHAGSWHRRCHAPRTRRGTARVRAVRAMPRLPQRPFLVRVPGAVARCTSRMRCWKCRRSTSEGPQLRAEQVHQPGLAAPDAAPQVEPRQGCSLNRSWPRLAASGERGRRPAWRAGSRPAAPSRASTTPCAGSMTSARRCTARSYSCCSACAGLKTEAIVGSEPGMPATTRPESGARNQRQSSRPGKPSDAGRRCSRWPP